MRGNPDSTGNSPNNKHRKKKTEVIMSNNLNQLHIKENPSPVSGIR